MLKTIVHLYTKETSESAQKGGHQYALGKVTTVCLLTAVKNYKNSECTTSGHTFGFKVVVRFAPRGAVTTAQQLSSSAAPVSTTPCDRYV